MAEGDARVTAGGEGDLQGRLPISPPKIPPMMGDIEVAVVTDKGGSEHTLDGTVAGRGALVRGTIAAAGE